MATTPRVPPRHLAAPMTVRLAASEDQRALAKLAALDSADQVPRGEIVLAEVAGELRAAVSLADGLAIADPFYPTAHLVELLRWHARLQDRPQLRKLRVLSAR